MAAFGEPATRQTLTATIKINGNQFRMRGSQTLQEGWFHFYKPFVRSEDTPLPEMKGGQEVSVEEVILEDRFAKPPPRYNPASLLRRMEKEEIGTKATRAGIIQTLYDRKYIRNEKIEVTDLGFEVTEILKKCCPTVVSLELTRNLEEKMNEIQQGRETRERVLADAIGILKPATEKLKQEERTIGERLSQAIKKSRLEERVVGACPTCHSGQLVILASKRTGKRFVGCTNYFEGICKTAFPLPQRGYVRPAGKTCRGCGWQTVLVAVKGKRPWNLCFNPECPLKEKSFPGPSSSLHRDDRKA